MLLGLILGMGLTDCLYCVSCSDLLDRDNKKRTIHPSTKRLTPIQVKTIKKAPPIMVKPLIRMFRWMRRPEKKE